MVKTIKMVKMVKMTKTNTEPLCKRSKKLNKSQVNSYNLAYILANLPSEIITNILWWLDLETLAYTVLPTMIEYPITNANIWDPKISVHTRHLSRGPACLNMPLVLACYELCDIMNYYFKRDLTIYSDEKYKGKSYPSFISMYKMYHTVLPRLCPIIKHIVATQIDICHIESDVEDLNNKLEEQGYDPMNSPGGDSYGAMHDIVGKDVLDNIQWQYVDFREHILSNSYILHNYMSPMLNNVFYDIHIMEVASDIICSDTMVRRWKFLTIIYHIIHKCVYSNGLHRDILPSISKDDMKMARDILLAYQNTKIDWWHLYCDYDDMNSLYIDDSINPYRHKDNMDRYSNIAKKRFSIWML